MRRDVHRDQIRIPGAGDIRPARSAPGAGDSRPARSAPGAGDIRPARFAPGAGFNMRCHGSSL
ncbi:hypothetical protein CA982_18185 [Gordonia lacunae]|uniref:Uncharacterized protein n=1 Tax=Gordonia lacunae TaxID=417102 RepID=A0A243Q7Y3_9ACTN|nr:hypothetical protein CA982_18185 [Gordonia lacunae]